MKSSSSISLAEAACPWGGEGGGGAAVPAAAGSARVAAPRGGGYPPGQTDDSILEDAFHSTLTCASSCDWLLSGSGDADASGEAWDEVSSLMAVLSGSGRGLEQSHEQATQPRGGSLPRPHTASPALLPEAARHESADLLSGAGAEEAECSSPSLAGSISLAGSLSLAASGAALAAHRRGSGSWGGSSSPVPVGWPVQPAAAHAGWQSPPISTLVSAADEEAGRHDWLGGQALTLDGSPSAAAAALAAAAAEEADVWSSAARSLAQQLLQLASPGRQQEVAGRGRPRVHRAAFLARDVRGIDLGLPPAAPTSSSAAGKEAGEQEGADADSASDAGSVQPLPKVRPRALALAGLLSPAAPANHSSRSTETGAGGARVAAGGTPRPAARDQGRWSHSPAPHWLAASLEAAELGLEPHHQAAAAQEGHPANSESSGTWLGRTQQLLLWVSSRLQSHPIELTPSEAGSPDAASPHSSRSSSPHQSESQSSDHQGSSATGGAADAGSASTRPLQQPSIGTSPFSQPGPGVERRMGDAHASSSGGRSGRDGAQPSGSGGRAATAAAATTVRLSSQTGGGASSLAAAASLGFPGSGSSSNYEEFLSAADSLHVLLVACGFMVSESVCACVCLCRC